MPNEGYKDYADLVEYKYKGKKSINRWNVGALKKASESLKKLNQMLADCYKKDESNKYLPLGADRLKKLQQCYRECLQAVNLAREKNSKTDILNTIHAVLRKDSATVLALKKENTLPEYFRRDVVTFEDMPEAPVGGALSERIPVQYTDENGKTNKGFFTKESFFHKRDYKEVFQDIIKQNDQKNPYGPLLSSLINSEKFKEMVEDDTIISFINNFNLRTNYGDISLKDDIEVWNTIFKENNIDFHLTMPDPKSYNKNIEHPTQIIYNFIDKFYVCEGLQELKRNQETKNDLYGDCIQINEGDNITDRNCAMTEIANLLGRNDLLAKSIPMEICYDGKKQKGIFMENAGGYDLQYVGAHSKSLHLNQMTASALKDIADLQVIDYISGNIDRHLGNMTYHFDENGKLNHITGIDHDLSMGHVQEDWKQWFPSLDHMRVISAPMAQKIQDMRQEDLMLMLAALDLPEKQKKEAWTRVTVMQKKLAKAMTVTEDTILNEEIQDGKLYIVPNDKWENIKLETLSTKWDLSTAENRSEMINDIKHHNFFSNLHLTGKAFAQSAKKMDQPEEEAIQPPERSYNAGTLVSPVFFPEVIQNDAQNIKTLFQNLEKTIGDGGLEKRSKKFKQMYSAIKDLTEWSNTNNKDSEKWTYEKKQELKKHCQTIVEKCQDYINSHNPYTSIGKQRQQVATELLEFLGAKGYEINQYYLQQENLLFDRTKAVETLKNLSNKASLTPTEKENAITMMKRVIYTDLQNGISEQTLKEALQFEQKSNVENLDQIYILNFVVAEADVFQKEMKSQLRKTDLTKTEQNEKKNDSNEKQLDQQENLNKSIVLF